MRQDFARYETEIVKKNLERLSANTDGDVNTVDFPIFIAYGWLTGMIVLLIEIVWKKMYNAYWVYRLPTEFKIKFSYKVKLGHRLFVELIVCPVDLWLKTNYRSRM